MSTKILIFDAKPYDEEFLNNANKDYSFDLKFIPGHLTKDTALLTKGYDAICVFVNDIIDKEIIDILCENKVKVIALRCAGYNNIDLKYVYGKLHIVRVPEYSPYAVSEHASSLLLSLNRKIHKAYSRTRDGNFSLDGLLGVDLHGKTAGIIGTGKIGKCLISILKGYSMKVLAYDLYPDEDFAKNNNIQYVPLNTLFSESDVISLHCPLNKDTHYLINDYSINLMKDGVILINTGRGALVKTDDLIKGLKSRKIGAAGLDVYEEENQYFFEDFSSSMISDDTLARLLTFPNVLVTSHQAFFTKEALTNIAETTLGNIKEFFNDGYLKNEICYQCDKECRKKQHKRCF